MKDVRVDAEGHLHCWKCGAMAFTEKRTFRAKAIGVTAGVLTAGVAGAATPLVTKKKLRCQVCGEYNDVGSAKPYEAPQPPAPVAALHARYLPRPVAPITTKGYMGSVTFNGIAVTITKTARGTRTVALDELQSVEVMGAGIGMAGIWFGTAGSSKPSGHSGIAGDAHGLTFRSKARAEFEALAAAINTHRVS